jgi:hypothetical protein
VRKIIIVDNCRECPYHEQMWTGEYAKPQRTYFCANSPVQMLIPNKNWHEIHEDCGLEDEGCELEDLENITRAYA